ncbi:hypothetical protein JL721_4871 [Aureococcus anophagefferens]|nr:hypothetical protein JL722_5233 [Aureococcus anophagefferens]KAH8070754.1 hypothetical protein JL721_4871 [Aureococcus anophagefferens]
MYLFTKSKGDRVAKTEAIVRIQRLCKQEEEEDSPPIYDNSQDSDFVPNSQETVDSD